MLLRLRATILGALALAFLSGLALAVFVYRDMIAPLRSKLVETQAMVEQREKLASLGLLAAGVAHEIRNPLTAIKAALFTQQKKFAAGSPEHADVKVVEREIVRLERIVNDFLQFARPAEPEPVVMAADLLLLETKLFFAPQLEKNRIQMILEPSAPMYVKVDPAQMKQVLINLVQNAADSIGQDGAITLRARHSRKPLLEWREKHGHSRGFRHRPGHSAEAQKRLFDPFFTTKENGTGPGLVHRRADCAKARRGPAVSNAGESRHDFWYPAATGQRMNTAAKILLIDDDPGIVDTLVPRADG